MLKTFIALTVMASIVLVLSLTAVYIWMFTYNAPVVPTCPIGAGSNILGAVDIDGVVTDAAITQGWVQGIRLENVQPAPGPGGILTAYLDVYNDEIVLRNSPETYRMQITFTNNDTPVAQTATCQVLVTVRQVPTEPDGYRTQYQVQRDVRGPEPASVESITWRRSAWGFVPALLVLLLAGLTLVSFVTPFYDLQNTWEGVQFLTARLGEEGLHEFKLEDDHAAIVQAPTSAPEVLVEPDTYVLSPFERVQSVVPLQTQGVLEVEGLSQDRFPVRYTAEVAFEIPREDHDAILQANTQGYLHHRRTPEEEVTEPIDYVTRVLTGEVQDAVCQILGAYTLDELGSEAARQELDDATRRTLSASAATFGATAKASSQQVVFNGVPLDAYLEQETSETAGREEQAKRQSRKMYYSRKSEAHRRAQEKLSAHVNANLRTRARSEHGATYSRDCLIWGVIETLQAPEFWEKIEADQRNAISRLKKRLSCASPTSAEEEETA
jgi:hypothetical protein